MPGPALNDRMVVMKYKILLVDDDRALLKMLSNFLELKGYEVNTASGGMEAMESIKAAPDLILLDINMPGMDGLELCRQIRDKISCPILFLTAKAEEQDRVNGLLSGGDDYILKPFSLKELEARIISHLKREERHRTKSEYRFREGLMIDYTAKEVRIDGKKADFTRTEYEIIEFLSMNPGQVFDRERIYEKVCGYDAQGDSRVITELIRRIRKKLAEYTTAEFIETVWGDGIPVGKIKRSFNQKIYHTLYGGEPHFELPGLGGRHAGGGQDTETGLDKIYGCVGLCTTG